MAKNDFYRRIEQTILNAKKSSWCAAHQITMDTVLITLHRDFGIGAERLQKFADAFEQNWEEVALTWNRDARDLDYTRDLVDRALQDACGDRFVPWEERYNFFGSTHVSKGDFF